MTDSTARLQAAAAALEAVDRAQRQWLACALDVHHGMQSGPGHFAACRAEVEALGQVAAAQAQATAALAAVREAAGT